MNLSKELKSVLVLRINFFQKYLHMDRRSLLFIVLISLSFFFINLYFTRDEAEKQQLWQAEEKAKQERLAKEKATDIAQRTANLDDLSLVELYADDSASHFLTVGWKSKEAVLALPPHEGELPENVYSRELGSTRSFTAYHLEHQDHLKSFAAGIYTSGSEHAIIEALPTPHLGQYDVQVITFTLDPDHPAEVMLGSLDDGAYTTLSLERIPSGIALLKGKDGYRPIGFIKNDDLIPLNDFPDLRPDIVMGEAKSAAVQGYGEQFYLLENGTMQLVFSEIGGAIVEINLPFISDKHPISVVRPIDADRRMLEIDPNNAQFPLHPSLKGDGILVEQATGGYYPLIRRNLIGPNGKTELKVSPDTYALSVVSAYPELANLRYKVVSHSDTEITFEGAQEMRKIRKTFRIPKEDNALPYIFELEMKVEGDTKGLWLTTGVPEAEWIAGSPAPALKYRITKNGSAQAEDASLPTESVSLNSISPDWICNSNGFFAIILDPQTEAATGFRATRLPGATSPSRLVALAQAFPKWNLQDLPGYMMLLPVKPGSNTSKFRVFAGPLSTPILKQLDAKLVDNLTGGSPEYILSQSFHGWFTFISEPFAKFLFWIMQGAYYVTHSWAFSIFIVTLVLRILLWPLNAWSAKSTAAMQKVSPKVAEIQERYKNDKKTMQLKMMEVYKENKVNPLSGCLPLLIQMPFLIGMFDLLKSAFALRGAPFIPGWIDDLSSPDVLFDWNYSIPLIGSEFHLLPILLGLVMFVQAKVSSPAPADVAKMTDAQRQQRSMMTFMAILFAVMFYSFPSGLNLYWLFSMLLAIGQQTWTSGKLFGKKKK